jgi:hypothetical protein
MKIIAFSGVRQAGKDTANSALMQKIPNINHLYFAKKLKEVCSNVFDIHLNMFDSPLLKDSPLNDEIYLDEADLMEVIKQFNAIPNYNAHIRPFIGVMCFTPRELLQVIGTDLLHRIDKDIHIKVTAASFKDGINTITDMRFVSEFDYLNNNYKDSFYPIYIQNSKAEAIASKDTHTSEVQSKLFKNKCLVIENNKSIEDFQKNVAEIITKNILNK